MLRYIALAFGTSTPAASTEAKRLIALKQASSPDWRVLLSVPGLTVLAPEQDMERARAYTLPGEVGCILGHVFTRGAGTLLANDDLAPEARRIAATRGRALVDDFWGNYVAFVLDGHGCHSIIRDPSGKIPCYHFQARELHVFFSDIADLRPLRLKSMSIDWEYLAAFIYSNDLQIRRCGLREVTELLAGDCWRMTDGACSQFSLWDPLQICRTAPLEDIQLACQQLLATTQTCIDAWLAAHQSILHYLSGGFDSSVVVNCASRSGVRGRIVCLNRYNEQAGEDERRYARLAAQHARAPLLERKWTESVDRFDDRLLSAPVTPKPSVPLCINLEEVYFREQLAHEVGAKAVWTGQGGDHLFFQMNTNLGASDYAHYHPFGLGLLSAIKDAAQLTSESYWSVLAAVMSAKRKRRRAWAPEFLELGKRPFVRAEVLPRDTLLYIAHPWTVEAADIPVGKQCQLYLIGELLNRHRPLLSLECAPEHHPLASQPIVELCLRIPTYVHLRGGKDRALARRAFAECLPAEIVERQSKGASTSSRIAALRRSMQFISELLLDGLLVREGIINRDEISAHLLRGQPLKGEQYFPLFACLAAEVWARQWSQAQSSSALAVKAG